MGKKKQLKEKAAKSVEEIKGGKKTYSLPSTKQTTGVSNQVTTTEGLPKVNIPGGLEKDLVDVILTLNQERKIDKEISLRLTNKKLMDIYTCLSTAGFSHKQIEQAMDSTIVYGGDLIDALDWLCLNLSNDKLPGNFSQTLQMEEEKKRPKFDTSLQTESTPLTEETAEVLQKLEMTSRQQEIKSAKKDSAPQKDTSTKDWILRYAEQSSDSDSDVDSETVDPNERYLELTALLLDAKEEAVEVKKAGMKDKQKEISKRIRQYIVEMDSLESHPAFNPSVKIKDIDAEKTTKQPDIEQVSDPAELLGAEAMLSHDLTQSHDQTKSHDQSNADDRSSNEDEEDLGLCLFQQAEESKEVAKEKTVTVTVKEDVRSFEYTRQQWTGKSPKQFLIDWVRKHLPKSPPPKFQKINPKGNKFKCKVTVDRQKDGKLEECPDILTQNVKEAEHLAATLALYHLCRGQSVHQLLPPPYRDVWLEWLDAERQAQAEEKSKENKPRDQFLSKLLNKIQSSGKDKSQNASLKMEEESDTLESWEDMDAENDKAQPKGKRNTEQLEKSKIAHQKQLYTRHSENDKFDALLKQRRELPVYQHKDPIVDCINKHNVVLIAGETGSGKSTQIPHFILQSCLTSVTEKCNIVCTEPRRISTISLATRVSQEMGENRLGDEKSLCGYQIRFESKMGPNTCLTYCTTGVLLRKLQMDPKLSSITHVIVDEVHERSVQSDFLLIILRELLQQGSHLKVILMSATIDAEKFSSYFSHCPVISIPGRTFPVQVLHVEDIVEQTQYVLDEDSPYSLRQSDLVKEDSATVSVTEKRGFQNKMELFWTTDNIATIDYTSLSEDKYSSKTRNTVTRMNFKRIDMDLIVELLVHLEVSEQFKHVEGAVLIFLPGLSDITELYESLKSDRRFYDSTKYLIIALHSVLSSSDQTLAFKIPPAGVRKIVLATNIAETGITIPDVVFVIDTGKVKENRYIESSQMNTLEEVFISKASAKQRQGRAGRVREGFCFRLFSKEMYNGLRSYTMPEILRVPLEELCLHIMKCEYGNPDRFLAKGLDPPQQQVVTRAMNLLHVIGACIEGEKLTPLGHHLAALPVHVRIGKMLLYASVFNCLEPMAVIAAAMTDKSPFVAPMGKQDLANAAKQALATSASDHITMYKAYLGWQEARSKGRQSELSYCQKNYLKRNTLLEIENVKCDLIKLVDSIGFINKTQTKALLPEVEIEKDGVLQISKYKTHSGINTKLIAKVKAILTAGLYPNVAMVTYDAPVDAAANPEMRVCVAETQQGSAHVHPSSVNRNLQANGWLVFHQKVKSTRVYLRDCSLISAYPLLLFGGEIQVQHTEQVLSVDEKINFKAVAKTGVIFKELRKLLDDVLARKLDDPKMDLSSNSLVTLIEELLVAERTR